MTDILLLYNREGQATAPRFAEALKSVSAAKLATCMDW
jgi:hypothetical protein